MVIKRVGVNVTTAGQKKKTQVVSGSQICHCTARNENSQENIRAGGSHKVDELCVFL